MKYEGLVPRNGIRRFSLLQKMRSISFEMIETSSRQITEEINIDEAKAKIDMIKTKALQFSSRLAFA
jgi:hypothetical protein